MSYLPIAELEAFIVRAKHRTYVGDSQTLLAYRPGSHDLQHHEGRWTYHDSYFGGKDFLGQEIVYYDGAPVWGMNYYGRILEPALITPAEAGQMIKRSLSAMYGEGRFLGGWRYAAGELHYQDHSEGDVSAFEGFEIIRRGEKTVYRLVYHGGLIE